MANEPFNREVYDSLDDPKDKVIYYEVTVGGRSLADVLKEWQHRQNPEKEKREASTTEGNR